MTTMLTDNRNEISDFSVQKNLFSFKENTVDKSLSSVPIKKARFYYTESKLGNLETSKNKFIKRDTIDKLSTFEEILKYGIDAIKLKDDYLFNRIRELKELCDSEEDEDYEISLESLKTMFLFLEAIGSIFKPSSLTVSETGLFYLEWERDRNNSITLRFKKDYFLDYVIFKPSLHINKRITFNGSMYALDLIDYLNDLNIKIHKKI
ncbi:conserved hypothetical protein [Planktothrix serta PCC 8927]|uniref:Uncharacterized protein n=1 Tax=Planktothrix serta PCC 8927 TaxID=671068 RepID=A0A7Z9BML4_9CYAN|nr:hypothetical protein [Planktothrix serta]VXD17927.1 conserved hypothetical protein [Planktothrix serta PCC 8927]